METKVIAVRHWDDLVFENRNKEYGAYSLRRRYSKRVILAWGVSVAMFAALLLTSQFSLKRALPGMVEIPIDGTIFQPLPPPIFDRPQPPPKQPAQPVRSVANTTPLVVTEPVEQTPIEQISTISSEGTETGTAPVEGIPDGVGSAPVEAPVIIEVTPTVNIAEHMPQFEGGNEGMIKYIVKNTRYPASARRMTLEGTVYVRFVVMADGSIEQAEVLRGFHPDCDKEAIRVIQKMPKWIAGSQNGRPVNVRMVVPIKFRLNG
jgi:protein TonB